MAKLQAKGLQYDIEVLILDLKSGNFENAMIDFENRVGNAYMSSCKIAHCNKSWR